MSSIFLLFIAMNMQLRLELDTKRGLIENAQFNENDVFISYCWADADLVRATAAKIASSPASTSNPSSSPNLQIWIDTEKMRGNIYNAMEEGVRLAKVFVSFISPKYAASANCQRELKLANDLRKTIVCCLVDPANRFENGGWPPPGIGTLVAGNVYLDLTKNYDQSFEELLSKIRNTLSPSSAPAPAPAPSVSKPQNTTTTTTTTRSLETAAAALSISSQSRTTANPSNISEDWKSGIDTQLASLGTRFETRFAESETQLASLETRFAESETQLALHATRIEALEKSMETRFATMEKNLESIMKMLGSGATPKVSQGHFVLLFLLSDPKKSHES